MEPFPANEQLVDRLIAEGALWSPAVIAAFRATPRHRFLDRVFQYHRKTDRWREVITRDPGPEELRILYSDRALITRLSPRSDAQPELPISSSSQPSLMAQMLEDMKLAPGQRALEIGAGTGYNAALLAHLVGPGKVVSVDVDRSVLAEAWDHLRGFADRQVELKHADGRAGFVDAAPYDRIMVTAATPDLEPGWLEQLSEGGLLLAPLALAPGLAYLVRGTVRDGIFRGRLTRAAYFMPLRGEHEAGTADGCEGTVSGQLQTMPAPWAGWFERRHPRIQWHSFIQALAFYALLRGLHIHYRSLSAGQVMFGLSDPDHHAVCWMGSQHWQVTGSAGQDLGWTLWRAFLEAGGPWPTEFDLSATPDGNRRHSSPGAYPRQGPRCHQLWEMVQERDRPAWL